MARKLDGEKRKRIIETARNTFGEHGFQRSTIKQIAEGAGLAPGTLYTYFSNKEELFSEVVEDIWQVFMSGMENISLSEAPFSDKTSQFLDFGFDQLRKVHPLMRGMFSDANKREMLIERVEEVCTLIEKFFEDARIAGALFGDTENRELRRFNIRVIVSGVMFRAALVPPEELDDEIEGIRRGIELGINERSRLGAGG